MTQKEQIRAEIERLINEYKPTVGGVDELTGAHIILAKLFSFIDSLPEEPGVDVTDFCKPIDPGIAQCVADHWWEMMEEEPDKSLEKEIQRYLREKCSGDDEPAMSEIARHFYELGLNAKEEEK